MMEGSVGTGTDPTLHDYTGSGRGPGHTTEVAFDEAGISDLPAMNLQDWDDQDRSGTDTEEELQVNAQLDSCVFDDRWKAQMEELSQLGDAELYASESVSGFLPDEWKLNQDRISSCLMAVGLTDRLLAYQTGEGEVRTILEQVLLQVGVEMSARQFLWHERWLEDKVRLASESLPISKRLRGSSADRAYQMLADSEAARRDRSLTTSQPLDDSSMQELAQVIPLRGMRKKAVASAGQGSVTRDQKDATDKVYWTAQVVDLLKRVRAPLLEMAASSTRPDDIFEVSVGATRGSTMKTYLQALVPFRNYLMMLSGSEWTDDVVHIISFLRAAASKPCSPTYPKRFIQALRWVMRVGGWTGPDLIAEHGLVQKSMDYWSEALFSQVHPLKQAPRLPWVVLAALELYICNDRHPRHLRYKAYTIMFKAIGTLREDDIQHLKARKLRTMGCMLVGDLMKSKTTGAAKRVRQLPVALHTEWTLTRSLWLENGIALGDELLSKDSDYMLPRFDSAGAALDEPCSYSESSALSKRVLTDLRSPIYHSETGNWSEGDSLLLNPALAGFWTEHSARPVVPTAAQSLGAPKESRDCLGRWSPTGADDYARAYRTAAGELQMMVLKAVLGRDRRLEESEVFDRILQLTEYGTVTLPQAEGMKSHLERAVKEFDLQVAAAAASGALEDIPAGNGLNLDPQVQEALGKGPVVRQKKKSKKLRFLIVYTRNHKAAKLHKVGGCEWTRATLNDAQEFDVVTDQMYDTRCKLCWKRKDVSPDEDNSDASSSDQSTL